MNTMSDPTDITDAIEQAQDAFEYIGYGAPEFEEGVNQDEDWKTQLTKACRYLETCRTFRRADGYNGACVELCFGAIERSLEGYILWNTSDDLGDYQDHEKIYDRVVQRGLFTQDTADRLKELYLANRTEHYYGGVVPTQEKADEMYNLAEAIHEYTKNQIREGGVCIC